MDRRHVIPAMITACILTVTGCGSSSASTTPVTGSSTCPNGGTLHFGVVNYEDSAKLLPIYRPLSQQLSKALGCSVDLQIASNYNGTIEAMRAGKLDLAEYGPLSYVLAHQVGNAQVVATYGSLAGTPYTYYASIVTPASSPIKTLADCAGKSFAYSDPASTSGRLYPAYGLKQAGIDPDTGVVAKFAGSHTASFEALKNAQVDCGELNSQTITATEASGEYDASQFRTLWKSDPIPDDPLAVRGGLAPAVKTRIATVLLALDLTKLPGTTAKDLAAAEGIKDTSGGVKYVPETESTYTGIRDLVKVLHVDLNKLG